MIYTLCYLAISVTTYWFIEVQLRGEKLTKEQKVESFISAIAFPIFWIVYISLTIRDARNKKSKK